MSFSKLLLLAAVLFGTWHLWKVHQHPLFQRSVLADADPYGFIAVRMPDGSTSDAVIILAPLNCPSQGAHRADALAKRLTEMGIANVRSSNYSISQLTADQMPLVNRTAVVLEAEIPAVLVRGMGKANPTADEVAFEYHRAN